MPHLHYLIRESTRLSKTSFLHRQSQPVDMEFKQREMREKESLQGPVTEKEITKITGGTDTAGKHRQHLVFGSGLIFS